MMAVRQTVFHYVRVSLALLLCISAQANVNGSKALRLYFTSRSACCVLCIRQVEEKYKHSRGTMIMRHGLLRVWQAWRVGKNTAVVEPRSGILARGGKERKGRNYASKGCFLLLVSP